MGVIGEVRSVDIRWSDFKSAGYYKGAHSPSPDDWRLIKSKSGGGMLMMTTCHAIHSSVYLTGQTPTKASAASQVTDQGGDVEHTLHGVISYSNGATGTISTSSNQHGSSIRDTTIAGSHGTLILGASELRYYSTRVISGKRPGRWHSEKFSGGEAHLDHWLEDTAGAIVGNNQLETSTEVARNTLAVIEALYSSASNESVVDVETAS